MLTISELSSRIESREISPVALLDESLERIARTDGELRSFITVTADTARQEAERAEERARQGRRLGPLDGIPIGVKDVVASRGIRTTAGSAILADFVPERDAPALAALRATGAVIVGKTNLHEFAYGVTSANRNFGAVLNPRDRSRIPGGSSGGSAAAVAAGLVAGAIGSDTGGSIRIPAAACGLVGLKPTFGLVTCEDVIPQAWSLDHLGPLTLCVEDARLLLEALTGRPYQAAASRNLRIGVPESLVAAASREVRTAFDASLSDLESLGASVQLIELPGLDQAHPAWLTILLAESAAYHRDNLTRYPDQIAPDVRPFLLAGTLVEAGRYLDAQRFRRDWSKEVLKRVAEIDFLVNPTLPVAVPHREAVQVSTGRGPMSMRDAMVFYQWPANLLGWPSIALPCGHAVDGLPASIMLTGKPHDEARLLALAQSFEDRPSARA